MDHEYVFEVDSVGHANYSFGRIKGCSHIVKPVWVTLLQKLSHFGFRREHVFFEVEASQAENVVKECTVPSEGFFINSKFFSLLVGHTRDSFVGHLSLKSPLVVDKVEENRLHAEHFLANLLHESGLFL